MLFFSEVHTQGLLTGWQRQEEKERRGTGAASRGTAGHHASDIPHTPSWVLGRWIWIHVCLHTRWCRNSAIDSQECRISGTYQEGKIIWGICVCVGEGMGGGGGLNSFVFFFRCQVFQFFFLAHFTLKEMQTDQQTAKHVCLPPAILLAGVGLSASFKCLKLHTFAAP